MKYEKNRKIAGIDELTFRKLLKFLAFPFIALILTVVIVIADRTAAKKKEQAKAATSVAVAESTSGTAGNGPDNNKYVNDFSNYGLQKNTIPEIDALVTAYQKAKTAGDAEAMFKVFGKKDRTGLDALQTKLTEEKKVYEAYKDTVNYIMPGLEKGAYIVYINCKIKFKGVDTPAPMLTRCYVVKDSAGHYSIKEPDTLTKDEQAKVDEADRSEDVRLMDTEMRTALAKAVVSDAKLGSLYQMWEDTGNKSTAGTAEKPTKAENATEGESVEEASIQIGGGTGTAAESTVEAAPTAEAPTTKSGAGVTTAAPVTPADPGTNPAASTTSKTAATTAAAATSAAQ